MSVNHLIIGLGGTGGKIIRSFRKTIFQEFRSENPDKVHMGYLYVDSSAEMMDLDDPSWKMLGTSMQLGKANQLHIRGANLQAVLDNVGNYPGIGGWIGDRTQWRDILNSVVGEVLGGQKRRLGRFLFANHAEKFTAQLQERVRTLQQDGNVADVTFHVCCGLAGGTGSGSLIDVICLIRTLYPYPHRFRLLVYALLPDSHPPHGWDTGNYHANGYAALLELNALSAGRFAPHDVTGAKARYQVMDPFTGCYVFTNENENGMIVDVNSELPDVVADFLYQKIVTAKDVGDWTSLRRMENAENGDGTPELTPADNLPERSKRFLTFGIKRLIVPEEEMLEYVSYQFAQQAGLQLLFNAWQDAAGFVDEPKNVDFHELVRQPDLLERWKLSDDHLCLSVGILEEDVHNRKWKPIATDWQEVIPQFKSLARDAVDKKAALDELGKLCAKRFGEDYRGLGVKELYRAKLRSKKEMARQVRGGIESELFEEWRNGVRSIHEIGVLLDALREASEERGREIDGFISRLKDQEATVADKVNGNYKEWSRIGVMGGLLGKRDKLIDAQASFLQDLYVTRTRLEGWQFAKELLQEVVTELNDFKAQVDKCASIVKQAVEKFRDRIAQRCNDEGLTDLKQHLIRVYDPETVRHVSARFVRDENVQRTQTGQVRAALVGRLGENRSFKAFSERVGLTAFMDTLEVECESSVKRAHENLIQNPQERLLGVNIIERLKERYSGDAHVLQSYVTQLVKYAGNFVSFSESEKRKRGPGLSDAPGGLSKFTVILPKAPEHAEFTAVLKEAFRKGHSHEVEIVETSVRPQEITLISITNLFPLRYLNNLPLLREKYEQRVDGGANDARARLEIHIEGDGTQHPGLFVPTTGELVKMTIPYLLLARVMGIIKEGKNPDTGLQEIVMVVRDRYGFETATYLGKSLADASEQVTAERSTLIKNEVEKALQSKDLLHKDARWEMVARLQEQLNVIKSEHGFDETYQRFLEGSQRAAGLLEEGR